MDEAHIVTASRRARRAATGLALGLFLIVVSVAFLMGGLLAWAVNQDERGHSGRVSAAQSDPRALADLSPTIDAIEYSVHSREMGRTLYPDDMYLDPAVAEGRWIIVQVRANNRSDTHRDLAQFHVIDDRWRAYARSGWELGFERIGFNWIGESPELRRLEANESRVYGMAFDIPVDAEGLWLHITPDEDVPGTNPALVPLDPYDAFDRTRTREG